MEIWKSREDIDVPLQSVVTIGNFDGVHLGHQKVLDMCVQRAQNRQVRAVACTFDPHPRVVHSPSSGLELISSLTDRLDAMAATGLDATFVIHYDASVYMLDAADFVERYLVCALGAVEVVVGQDFRFGRGNSATVETLKELGERYGFDVVVVTDVESPEGRRWSSSWVRELLKAGDVTGAARVLGRVHRIRGRVTHGAKRGRTLGFPTANLCGDIDGVVPGDGVYAGWLVRRVVGTQATEFLPAAISVGTNPQFGGGERTVEAHVLGRADLDLYDEDVSVTFVAKIRPMRSFDCLEDLLNRMDIDLRETAAILGVAVAGRVDPASVTAGM